MLPLLQLFHTWLPVLLVLPLVLVLFLPVAAAGSHYTTRGRPDDAAARAEETQRLLELAAEDFRDHWWLVQPKNDITMETIMMVWERLARPLSKIIFDGTCWFIVSMLTIDTIQHLGQAGPLCARCCRREDGEEDLSAPPMDSGAGAGGGVAGGGGSGGGATLPAGGGTTGDKSGLTDTGSPGGGDDGGQKPAPGGAATVAAAAEQHRNDADTDDQSDSKSDSSRQSGPDPSTERRPRRGTRGGPPPGPPPGYNGRAGGLYSSGQQRNDALYGAGAPPLPPPIDWSGAHTDLFALGYMAVWVWLGLRKGTGLILPLHICNVFAVYATAGAANAMATAARPAILPLTMLVLVHWLDLSDWVAGPLE